ncbi:replication/maintenance protein RepL [Candidatus Arsenophonus triatominarum]|uniref:replication/maintenance protein RepL n=1 Tax=Candidatus Arsenophonus triatominarum TaxID=57911 RepID=UPI0007C557D5|nr:replication/maintenance protein RepL [Candidatus Arsenophonus triatominarum]
MAEIRYESNPFLENMVIPFGRKTVKLSPLGREDNILVNQFTGEIRGTHVATYKKVDSQCFVKLFTENIALAFNLKSAGIKALTVLIFIVQKSAMNKDVVNLDSYTLKEFLNFNEGVKLSMTTFRRGLIELEEAKIIAKALRKGNYFINPNFVFNGDRIAFSTIIEKENAISSN